MENIKNSTRRFMRGLAVASSTMLLTMLPAQVLAVGFALEHRPSAPAAANYVVVVDDNGIERLIGQRNAEVLLVRHDEDAHPIDGHRRRQMFSFNDRRRWRPLEANNLCWAFPNVLESSLETTTSAGSDDRHDLPPNHARSVIEPLGGKTRGLGGHNKTYHCKKADEQRDDQVQPLEGQPGSSDLVGGGNLPSREPLGAKIAVVSALWALAMGFIPVGIIWLGLARTLRGQAIGAAITCSAFLAFGVCFSVHWAG